MGRTVGFLLIGGGLLLAIGSYSLRFPFFIGVNRYFVEAWVVGGVVGLAVAALGAVIIRRTA